MTKRYPLQLCATAAAFFCGAAAYAQEAQPETASLGRPIDLSRDGHLSDWLFDYTTTSISILFFIMCCIIAWVLLNHRSKHKALYTHGDTKKHMMLTAAVASVVFFGVDGVLLVNSFAELHEAFWNFPAASQNPLNIEVMAQQWAWSIRYPGPDGKFNTPDDILTLNEMHIPVDRPVVVKLQSKDVIHSFYLPNFRVKQDAFPGTITKMWFQAPGDRLAGAESKTVEIGCAQHCGTNHYKMKGWLTIHTQASYDAWEREAAADAQRRFDPSDTEAQWGWDWESEGKLTEVAATPAPANAHGEEK